MLVMKVFVLVLLALPYESCAPRLERGENQH